MDVSDIFDNREIATFVWLVVFAVFALRSRDVRKSLTGLLKQFASVKMLLPMILLAAYIGGIVYLLHRIGLWNTSLLKNTLFWFFSAGLLTMFKYVQARKGEISVRKMLYDNVKFIVILEFILNTFTFSLWAELVIVPIVTIIVMMNAYVEATNGDRKVAKFLGGIQGIVGLGLIGHGFYAAIADYRVFGTLDTARSFVLPILLSAAIIPAAYLFAVYTNYESLFVGFKIGKPRESSLVRYCKWKVILHCGLSTRRIARLRPFDMMHLESKKDVKDMLMRREEAASEEVINV